MEIFDLDNTLPKVVFLAASFLVALFEIFLKERVDGLSCLQGLHRLTQNYA